MWEVVLESRYQSDLELLNVSAVAIYVRLFRLEFPSSAWFDLSLFSPFLPHGPFPSMPPPFAQQSFAICPFFLQL